MTKVYQNILTLKKFDIPKDWLCIETIDMHTAGEPLRVVVNGSPDLNGQTILEYRRHMMEHLDHYRTILMFEPRGHADMYGCILTSPNDETADFGILFMHNEGFSTMCGHAIIAISKLAVEMGWKEKSLPQTHLEIDAPCGRISSRVNLDKSGKVIDIEFDCVPSFVVGLDFEIILNGQRVKYDLAYGGAFYAYVNADQIGLPLTTDNTQEIIRLGREIKQEVIDSNNNITHPFEDDLSFLYGTIFISEKAQNGADDRNVCVFADGEIDRSPTGSGVSGRMAIHAARNKMNEYSAPRLIESIIGSQFQASIKSNVKYCSFNAVIPTIRGNAHVIGQNQWIIDPDDQLRNGFLLR